MSSTVIDKMFEGIEDEDVVVEGDKGHVLEAQVNSTDKEPVRRLKKARDLVGQVDTPPSMGEGRQHDDHDDDGANDADGEEQYWDEEDEIEEYLQHVEGDEDDGSRTSDDEEENENNGEEEDIALIAGDGTTRGDMDADTQRLLREVATKDRLGKGHKIQIKPLEGIVEKLKKKKEQVLDRAAELRAPCAPKFHDILNEVGLGADDKAHQDCDDTVHQDGNNDGNIVTPRKQKHNAFCKDDNDDNDLEVISDGEDDGNEFKLIDVPKQTPQKPSPLAFNPYNDTQMEEFEEENVLDDGAESESDEESDHSWAVKEGEENDDDTVSSKEDSADCSTPAEKRSQNPLEELMKHREEPKQQKETKRSNFVDEEAELSDEEGMGAAVSDDEEEENADVDANGELKDLIAEGHEHHQKDDATEELHIKWARQQESQQLKDILRGLENGFGRRNRGALDEYDGELTGRQRRARHEDGSLDDFGLGTSWPDLFGKPNAVDADGEECEDEAMLRKAQQRKLVESQQSDILAGSKGVPLDEDSQQILELFANSASENQNSGGSETLKRRSKDMTAGSDGLSFIGRKQKIHRHHSVSNLGISAGKSFVFGRKDSYSRQGTEEQTNTDDNASAPVDFSDLQKLTQPSSQENSSSVGNQQTGSLLLKKLPRWNKPSNFQKKGSASVIGAVCQHIAPKKANR